jgi:hypothetical protein
LKSIHRLVVVVVVVVVLPHLSEYLAECFKMMVFLSGFGG